jgi:peptidoglycan/LPS O-acetylase OafA/YrhL
MNKVNFPALTGIRALAAFMVYIHHYNPFSVAIFGQYCHDFFSEFHIGVTVFFVLSGFLICNRYYEEQNFSFKSYFIKRFARIYPMYFFLTTSTFVFFAIFHSQTNLIDLKNYFFNISLLKGFSDDLKFTGIAQSWSLTVEEVFYFLAPIFFLLIKKNKLFLIITPLFFVGFGLLLVTIFNGIDCYGFMKSINFMLDFTFFGRVTEFFVGIALALLLKNNRFDLKFEGFTYFGFFGIILSICALVYLKVGTGFGVDTLSGKVINTFFLPVFGIAPLFLGLIKEKTILQKFFSTKIILLLGKSSYIFYLIHLGIFVTILNKISSNQEFIFIALNVISVVLYQYLESPLNKIIRKNIN